jgi:hypothetical protein
MTNAIDVATKTTLDSSKFMNVNIAFVWQYEEESKTGTVYIFTSKLFVAKYEDELIAPLTRYQRFLVWLGLKTRRVAHYTYEATTNLHPHVLRITFPANIVKYQPINPTIDIELKVSGGALSFRSINNYTPQEIGAVTNV